MSVASEEPAVTVHVPFDNSYARLPERVLRARGADAGRRAAHSSRSTTRSPASSGIDPAALATPEGVAVLAGNARA